MTQLPRGLHIISPITLQMHTVLTHGLQASSLSAMLLQGITPQDIKSEAVAKQLMAEEEQSKAKLAAKNAKKYKQKAKKGQPACQSAPDVSPAEAEPVACLDSNGASSLLDAAASPVNTSLGLQPSPHVQHLTTCSEADADNATFLEQLFCCPLTQVRVVV